MKTVSLLQQIKRYFVKLMIASGLSIPLLMLLLCFDLYCPDSLLLCFHYPHIILLIATAIVAVCYWLIFFRANMLLEVIFKNDQDK